MVGNVQLGGKGNFIVDGQTFDLSTLMMYLNLDRTKMIDTQIADQMSEVKERNVKLKSLNELLSSMRDFKARGVLPDFSMMQMKLPDDSSPWQSVTAYMKHFGITPTQVAIGADKKVMDAGWDANIESVKGMVDSLNSDSQLSMIRMQSLIDKRNQTFELTSNLLQSDKKVTDNIIGNMR